VSACLPQAGKWLNRLSSSYRKIKIKLKVKLLNKIMSLFKNQLFHYFTKLSACVDGRKNCDLFLIRFSLNAQITLQCTCWALKNTLWLRSLGAYSLLYVRQVSGVRQSYDLRAHTSLVYYSSSCTPLLSVPSFPLVP